MNLDPNIREKLLKETREPFKGLRRVVWIALSASALVGLLIMGLRFVSGETVLLNDFAIQIVAFLLFGILLILDRPSKD